MIRLETTKTIYFDMDGTVADLYGKEDWLPSLRNEKAGTFIDLKPMVNMQELKEVCIQAIKQGWEIGVITWLPMKASNHYETICTLEKLEWIKRHMPYVREFYPQTYGTPKREAPRRRSDLAILIDDNEEIRKSWGEEYTIDATKSNIVEEIRKLIEGI